MWMPHSSLAPPPASGSDVFAGFDGSGAGCAAEGWVTFVVEFVVGDFVFFDELLNLFERPVGEGIDLVVVVGGVPFDDVY